MFCMQLLNTNSDIVAAAAAIESFVVGDGREF
jgi:hypothetical protein